MEIKYYPTVERIIELNAYVLLAIPAKKADRPQTLSRSKLLDIVHGAEKLEGDVYDKAVLLLQTLIKMHPFASGNRRTAFLVVVDFLSTNQAHIGVTNNPVEAKVSQGIREDYYTSEELKEWLQHGKIKPFKR